MSMYPNAVCASNTYADPKRQPAVTMTAENVGYAINDLESILADLFSRLAPVIRVEPQSDKGGSVGAPIPTFATPLADSLQTQVNRINYLTANISSLASRLEV